MQLQFHKRIVELAVPKAIELKPSFRTPELLYSDVEWSPGALPGAGFLLLRRPHMLPRGVALKLPQRLLDT